MTSPAAPAGSTPIRVLDPSPTAAAGFIATRYKVDLRDWIASPADPLHEAAKAAQSIANRYLDAEIKRGATTLLAARAIHQADTIEATRLLAQIHYLQGTTSEALACLDLAITAFLPADQKASRWTSSTA